MKKIMFNDRYGLTEAVLSGRKTQTRRIIPVKVLSCCDLTENPPSFEAEKGFWIDVRMAKCAYQIGEIVAVAQSYKDAGYDYCMNQAAYINKMFVKAEYMPHCIRITNVRVERLQDISDEDCIAEGVVEVCVNNNWGNCASHWEYNVPYEDDLGRAKLLRGLTPQETYATLIDRISGNGTWESNPYVFVYDFELVK